MDNAAYHLDVVKFLHENRTEGCTTNAMDWAAENGHLDIVKFLHENRTEGCTKDAMNWAAQDGHLNIVKFLHENRTEGCTTYAMDMAAENGHLNDDRDDSLALIIGLFLLLLYLFCCTGKDDQETPKYERNVTQTPLDHILCNVTQTPPNHDIKRSVAVSTSTMMTLEYAAEKGRLDLIKTLFDVEKYSAPNIIDIASKNGYLDIVEFLHSKHQKCTTSAMDLAAANGHIDVVRFLNEQRFEGCTVRAMDFAAANGHLNVLEFLHGERSEGCTGDATVYAAANGHIEVLRFLFDHYLEGRISEAIEAALRNGHQGVVDFMFDNYLDTTITNDPQVFLFKEDDSCMRLFLKTLVKIDDRTKTMVNFVISTGYEGDIILSDHLWDLMRERIDDSGNIQITAGGETIQCNVERCSSVNIIGLRMLVSLGIDISFSSNATATFTKYFDFL